MEKFNRSYTCFQRFLAEKLTSYSDFFLRSMKENKLTQTVQPPVEGLECLVIPPHSALRVRKLGVTRRNKKHPRSEFYQEAASSSGSNNELSTLLPTNPLLSAFLASRRDAPPSLCVCLPSGENLRLEATPPRHNRLKRAAGMNRR